MNLANAMIAAFRRAPAGVRGRVTFHHSDGRTTCADAVGAPAASAQSALSADQFATSVEIEERHRRLSVVARDLEFRPRAGMIAEWGAKDDGTVQRWKVLGVAPVAPDGKSAVLYRVTLKR